MGEQVKLWRSKASLDTGGRPIGPGEWAVLHTDTRRRYIEKHPEQYEIRAFSPTNLARELYEVVEGVKAVAFSESREDDDARLAVQTHLLAHRAALSRYEADSLEDDECEEGR